MPKKRDERKIRLDPREWGDAVQPGDEQNQIEKRIPADEPKKGAGPGK